MEDKYSRRRILAGGALALLGTTLIGKTKVEAFAVDPMPEPSRDNKTRTASCNCGQLRVTTKGPDP